MTFESTWNPHSPVAHQRREAALARLAQWQAPLLLVHAEQDTMVRVQQSRVLADALKAAGKPVTFLRLPSATQSLAHPPDRTQVVQAIDELLAPLLVKTP